MQTKRIPEWHYAILTTFIKLPFVINSFVLSIFEWPFYTGFTVYRCNTISTHCNPHNHVHYRILSISTSIWRFLTAVTAARETMKSIGPDKETF